MRVALIIPGGVDPSLTHRVMPSLLWMIERLARRHEYHVIALFQDGAPPRYPLLGATVHHIGRHATARRALLQLWRLHREEPFDVLHAFWGSPAGVLAGIAARVLRRPAVLHLFGGELVALPDIGYGELRTRGGRLRIRLALASAARITVQSRTQQEQLAQQGLRAERLPIGVDLRSWPAVPPRPREPGRPARLIHVASLNPVKDQSTLIEAAGILARTGRRFSLEIIGEDTLNGRIQAKTEAEGLRDIVTFRGFMEQSRVRQSMLDADLLVMTSRSESGPTVLLEAAASGVPAVGTAVGLFADFAPDAAVAVPPQRPDLLAREIARLLDDEPRRLQIARAAQERALREDADWSAERFDRIYHEVAAG